ncbi:MAG: hypothetical protein HYX28_00635 [Candidatus Koribacter versatilis]|uniref:Uncharacterized protein n=1 Tax=Candidatus Korobacter versatilis TaxID=658062 RepID=A0A932A6W7_9BACT|nr:hypothetical protein [Candidatus Koribacter versatilis]
MFGPIRCDAHGGIYYRPVGALNSAFESPVIRVEADKSSTRFTFDSVEGLPRELYAFTFDVDPAGRVYALVAARDQTANASIYVLAFSNEGEFLRKTRLEVTFRPSGAFLALPNDTFLISGVKDVSNPEEPQPAFVALFRDGRIIRPLLTTPKASAKKRDPSKPGILDPVLQFAQAAKDREGTIYLLKATSPPQVDVFSATGTLIRSVTLAFPFPGARPAAFFVDGSHPLVMYQPPQGAPAKEYRLFYTKYDARTGEPIVTYLQQQFGTMACVEDGEVTFLRSIAGRMVLGETHLK